jgi:hypothetical protein
MKSCVFKPDKHTMKEVKGHGSDARSGITNAAHQAGIQRIEPAPIVGPARYAKNMMAIQTPSNDGYKTRAARLADAIANSRYSGRENAYIMSKTATVKFQKLYIAGWDAGNMSRKLYAPDDPQTCRPNNGPDGSKVT